MPNAIILFQIEIDEVAHLQGFIPKSNFRLNRNFFFFCRGRIETLHINQNKF